MELLMKSSDEEDNIFSDKDMDAPGPSHNRSTPRAASSENETSAGEDDDEEEEEEEEEEVRNLQKRKRIYDWSANSPATKRHSFDKAVSGLRISFEDTATHLDFFKYFSP